MTKTRKPGETATRDDRLGAALRANLARRKAQARARAHQDEQQEGDASQDNAPESEE